MLTIDWKPDNNLPTSLYKQIADYIKKRIAIGEWGIGSKLPTQRELARIFNVNRSTIVEALDELKAEGLIEGKGNGGTVVINNTWSLLASTSPLNWYNYIKSGIYKPNRATIQSINKLEYEKDIIRLGTGELSPELYPKEMMKTVLSNISNRVASLGYEEPKGLLFLRETIAQYLKKFNINVSPAAILIVSGSLQALQLVAMGILQSGSTVLVENPSYLKSLYIFESYGMKLKGISMDDNGIKPDEMVKNSSHNATTLLYTIPTLHNPTGRVMPLVRRKQILEICEKNRLPIIEDDAYRELWLDEEPPMPLKAIDKQGIVLYMGTISKTLAPGLRIGWIVGPESVIERLGDVKMQTDYGASSLSQWVVAEWISSGLYESYLLKLREDLKVRRKTALDILQNHFLKIAEWHIPTGGFYIWLKLKKQLSLDRLFEISAMERILINPGNIYDFSKNPSIRISYAYASLADLERGLVRLAQLIKECD